VCICSNLCGLLNFIYLDIWFKSGCFFGMVSIADGCSLMVQGLCHVFCGTCFDVLLQFIDFFYCNTDMGLQTQIPLHFQCTLSFLFIKTGTTEGMSLENNCTIIHGHLCVQKMGTIPEQLLLLAENSWNCLAVNMELNKFYLNLYMI